MIDPWHITVTHHAKERYCERRSWGTSYVNLCDAEAAIRNLLARCAHQNPPLKLAHGNSGRLYRTGDFVFVVSGDEKAVITCYGRPQDSQGRRRGLKKAQRARSRAER
jgi:hypothetical protein